MKNKSKELTIITVVKNDRSGIEKTIKSIILQKTKRVEYIVVDGNSKDGTKKIINKFKDKIDKIISEKDRGIYYAMNKGITNSSGNIIGFCNSGDILFPSGLKTILKNFKKKKIDVLFATVKRNYIGKTIIKHGFKKNRIFYNFDFATTHSTGFYIKKKIHDEIGLYDTKFIISADYDFYLRLIKLNKFKLGSSNKKNIIGEMMSGGHSSKFSYIKHLNEETKIRLENKQNLILVILIYLNSVIKNFHKII